MNKLNQTVAQQVAEAARRFQEQNTGRAPDAVTVVLSNDTIVITLHDALSPAERALSKTPEGAAQVQDFHRQLFKASVEALCLEIKRITGIAVCEAAAEIETTTGTIVHAFTKGNMVQVFQMAESITQDAWNSTPKGEQLQGMPG